MKYPLLVGIGTLIFLSSCTTSRDLPASPLNTTSARTESNLEVDEIESVTRAKKRRAYMEAIRKADYFALRNQFTPAINEYLALLEKLGEDHVLLGKIANTYFEAKDWSKAYEYYQRVGYVRLPDGDRKKMLMSLLFSEEPKDVRGILESLPLEYHDLEYYKTIDTCHTGIHNCLVTIMAYAGTGEKIVPLKDIVNTYEKISPDYHYRNILVATKLFEQGSYRASMVLAEEILRARPDYQEAKKILGFSYFELGKYEKAREHLSAYLELMPEDVDTIVALGKIHYFLGDYTISNLYLNNAILANYTPKINLERQLAYNYMMLDDYEGTLKVVGYLLQNTDAKEDDFIAGVSIALTLDERIRAYSWATEGLSQFPNSSILYTLRAIALRTLGKFDEALEDVTSALSIAPGNTRALVEKGIIHYHLGDFQNAEDTLMKVRDMTIDVTLVADIERYLNLIQEQVTTSSGNIFP